MVQLDMIIILIAGGEHCWPITRLVGQTHFTTGLFQAEKLICERVSVGCCFRRRRALRPHRQSGLLHPVQWTR